MFILQNRKDYRDHLEHMMKMLQSQRNVLENKKYQQWYNSAEHGLGLALGALDEWDKRQPEKQNP